jgi:hypothetical protein
LIQRRLRNKCSCSYNCNSLQCVQDTIAGHLWKPCHSHSSCYQRHGTSVITNSAVWLTCFGCPAQAACQPLPFQAGHRHTARWAAISTSYSDYCVVGKGTVWSEFAARLDAAAAWCHAQITCPGRCVTAWI